jgi:PhnB protein
MKLNPYLHFNGDCEQAFKFYEKCLGGKLTMMAHRGSQAEAQCPPDWLDKILHARLVVGNETLMGSDAPPQYQLKPQGFCVSIGVNDPAEAERIYSALSENGTIRMPLQETFWARRFGMFIDQFGTPWMVNCEKPM